MSSVIFFHLHFNDALPLNPLALILGKEVPSSPEINPPSVLPTCPLSLPQGIEDTDPAPSSPLSITCYHLVQSCPNFGTGGYYW